MINSVAEEAPTKEYYDYVKLESVLRDLAPEGANGVALFVTGLPGRRYRCEVLGAMVGGIGDGESTAFFAPDPSRAGQDGQSPGHDDLPTPGVRVPTPVQDANQRADTRIAPASDHYRAKGVVEPIHLIESQKLPFHLANVVKYVCRWDLKDGWKDLLKAEWYLNRFMTNFPGGK